MTELITQHDLIARAMNRGLPEGATAEAAVHATLAILGHLLTTDETAALDRRLASGLARLLVDGGDEGDDAPAPAFDRERVQIVLHALGELLDGEMRHRLARVLPASLSRAVLPPDYGDPPPYANTPGTTLATGHPGHSQSVANSAHPHAARKLSSGHAIKQSS